ncbi:MAG: hypothetical protein IJF49_08285 [Clostridia bacterium]|nr:hypothetical protein [Clostridia bacterium]
MDIVLERILSLIPRKPNGDFVHGAKRIFAQSIGYKGGEIISDWIAGRSDAYLKKVYEISEKYDVNADWLLGKTDKKEKPVDLIDEPKSKLDVEFNAIWADFSEDQKRATIEFMKMFNK